MTPSKKSSFTFMKKILSASLLTVVLIASCNRSKPSEDRSASSYTDTPENGLEESVSRFIDLTSVREVPYYDSTNFDNISAYQVLPQEWIDFLGLKELYPYQIDGMPRAWIRNRVNLSDNYITLVIGFYPNENELFTMLATYTNDYQLIDFERIAYDEIAESCFRTESYLNADKIVVYNIDFCYQETTDTIEYRVRSTGEIVSN